MSPDAQAIVEALHKLGQLIVVVMLVCAVGLMMIIAIASRSDR